MNFNTVNMYTGAIEEADLLEWIPSGWRIAFGEDMLNAIAEEIDKSGLTDFAVQDVKEKYGGLRFYCYGGNQNIDDIVYKYEMISENVCIICGKPDVPILNLGWISPYCKDCYDTRLKRLYKKDYEAWFDNTVSHDIQTHMKINTYSSGETKIRELDASNEVVKIRSRYKALTHNLL